jgi:hypothetical protein
MNHQYIRKSLCQIEYLDPHHPLGVGTINRKDTLWMNALTLMTNTNTHYVVRFGRRQCNIYGRIFKRNINNQRGTWV